MCEVREGPRRMVPVGGAWHGFSALRSSAQAPNLHAPPTQQNKSPIRRANYTDLHILEEISAMICSVGANLLGVLIPTPPAYKSVLPISFPSSSTPATLACSSSYLQVPAFAFLFPLSGMFFPIAGSPFVALCSKSSEQKSLPSPPCVKCSFPLLCFTLLHSLCHFRTFSIVILFGLYPPLERSLHKSWSSGFLPSIQGDVRHTDSTQPIFNE